MVSLKRFIWFGIVVLLSLTLSSCVKFLKLAEEVERLEGSYYLRSQLSSESKTNKNVLVFVWEKDDTGIVTITDVGRLRPGGSLALMVAPGDHYYVGALEDANGNEYYDPGERAWFYGNPSPVPFTNGKSDILEIDLSERITLSEEDRLAFSQERAGRSYLALKSGGQIPLVIGEIADLDDPKFSAEMGDKGLWEPVTFLNETGAGVYFLSEYDPDKIPVLFVHGTGGSPLNWKYIFEKLDNRRYQKWFYHYPSGLRIERISGMLNHIIQVLHRKHRFSEMNLVAHSMGGLVSRSFIIKNHLETANGYITKFVSISTPWNGHEAAALGVKHAPSVIPSWIDMQINSPFINDLFEKRLSDKVDYYLLFGFRGKDAMFLPSSNDGTVSLASQLDPRAQREAKMRFGFDRGHAEILVGGDVVETLESILNGDM
jgi:pimeloyl-ACP methyl ester carboxylesterase